MKLNLELARKYSRPGPRYTSYPTAPQFGEAVGAEDYLNELSNPQVPVTPEISLYFHLPFCRSLCYFCACNVIITHRRKPIADYLQLLKKEIDLVARHMADGRKVGQLHWGGGTPTYLTADEIKDLMGHIRSRFAFSPDAEVSVEIDPRELSADQAEALAEAGFNRASCGLQDFNEEVQKAVNRLQSYEQTEGVLELLRDNGIEHVNLDLIYGLPHQTVESFARTLEQVLTLHPSRLAVYNYAYVPWLKKNQTMIDEAWLPGPEVKLEMFAHIITALTTTGNMTFIGMDHFARHDDELATALERGALHRNFQGYSTRAGLDLYALGITSIGQTRNYYVQNHKQISRYRQSVEAGQLPTERGIRLTDEDHLRRRVIQDIMCRFELNLPDLEQAFNLDFRDHFAPELKALAPFEEDDLLVDEGDRLLVTEQGRLFIRNIAMTFDAYLPKNGGGQAVATSDTPQYSKTV